MLNPKEFANAMWLILNKSDVEENHSNANDLMCEVLTELGYGEGVEIFKKADKWYA